MAPGLLLVRMAACRQQIHACFLPTVGAASHCLLLSILRQNQFLAGEFEVVIDHEFCEFRQGC